MRLSFGVSLVVAVTFFFGYAYYSAEAICPAPLSYRIGELDPEFNLSTDTARVAISEAESVWEQATGQNLFTYDPSATFTINFIYDERQAFTDAEESYRSELDKTKNQNDQIGQQYTTLVNQYHALQDTYNTKSTTYKNDLASYNADVASYNASGGAPPKEYRALEERRALLDTQRTNLNKLSDQLNTLVKQINDLGTAGNELVESYNKTVATYNDTFGTTREFTQGTYHGDGRIDIYSFVNHDELKLVLAHELGHALSLDHVDNEQSIMYYLISKQPLPLVPSTEDLTEFAAVCGHRGIWDRIELGANNLLNQFKTL